MLDDNLRWLRQIFLSVTAKSANELIDSVKNYKHIKMRVLILIVFTMLVNAGCTHRSSEGKELSDEQRMDWWEDARFGMFIHWGIYSIPAGFYKGEAQTNSAEWIMNKGKINCTPGN